MRIFLFPIIPPKLDVFRLYRLPIWMCLSPSLNTTHRDLLRAFHLKIAPYPQCTPFFCTGYFFWSTCHGLMSFYPSVYFHFSLGFDPSLLLQGKLCEPESLFSSLYIHWAKIN
jgi:hypothetical protein